MAENLETQNIEIDPNEVTIEIDSLEDTKPAQHQQLSTGDEDNSNDESERERKRLERKQRLQKQRDARARSQEKLREQQEEIEQLRAEMSAMRNQHEQFSSEASKFYRQQLEEKIVTSQQLMNWYQTQLSEAVSTADGTKAAEMTALIEQERAKMSTYGAEKQSIDQRSKQTPNPQAQIFEQRKQRLQQKFISQNSDWFNDPSFAAEKRIAMSIDQNLANEMVYTADQPEYWEELNYRIKNHPRLKDIVNDDFDDSVNQPQHNRQPATQKSVTGGSGTSGVAPGKVRLKFEPHHIEGLRRMGIMDDDGRVIKGQEQRAIKYHENILRIRAESNNR